MIGRPRKERNQDARGEIPGDFLDYVTSIGDQLVYLARQRRYFVIAYLLDMVVKEAAHTLTAEKARKADRADIH